METKQETPSTPAPDNVRQMPPQMNIADILNANQQLVDILLAYGATNASNTATSTLCAIEVLN